LNELELDSTKQQGTLHNKNNAIRSQNVHNDHRHKNKIAIQDHSSSSILGSVESQ